MSFLLKPFRYWYCPFDHDKLWIRFFGRLGTARHFSRPNFCSGTRCAHQFWPQCARSAASAGARLAAGLAAGQAARARARTHPTKIAARIEPDLRIQIVHALSQLDSCTRGWMGGRACDGMEVDCQDGAGCPIALRNLLRANSSAPTS